MNAEKQMHPTATTGVILEEAPLLLEHEPSLPLEEKHDDEKFDTFQEEAEALYEMEKKT